MAGWLVLASLFNLETMMSWLTMAKELGGPSGQTPCPFPQCLNLINRSWLDVQGSFLWSFLWGDAAIPTPAPIQNGTVTLVLGSDQVVGDANAQAAWNASTLVNPITTMQFRIGQGTIYNIISYDFTTGTLTLDRPYVDPTFGSLIAYQIVGVYYNAPVPDFLWWETMIDPISGYTLVTTKTREEAAEEDPQRFQSGWPEAVMPYLINPWPGSFNGYPMYEMWPTPLNNYTYVGQYYRKGLPFTNYSDVVSPALGEDVVLALAKYYAYQWCEANKDKLAPEQRKGDFRFLMGAATREYEGLLHTYQLQDEEFSHRHVIPHADGAFISSLPWVSQRVNTMYAP